MLSPMILLSSLMMVFLGIVKMSLSKSLVSTLISVEMVTMGIFFILAFKWWMLMKVQFIVIFLVISVMEGTVGLLISIFFFRNMGISSSSSSLFS